MRDILSIVGVGEKALCHFSSLKAAVAVYLPSSTASGPPSPPWGKAGSNVLPQDIAGKRLSEPEQSGFPLVGKLSAEPKAPMTDEGCFRAGYPFNCRGGRKSIEPFCSSEASAAVYLPSSTASGPPAPPWGKALSNVLPQDIAGKRLSEPEQSGFPTVGEGRIKRPSSGYRRERRARGRR